LLQHAQQYYRMYKCATQPKPHKGFAAGFKKTLHSLLLYKKHNHNL